MIRNPRNPAFTLIELVLMLMLVAVTLALAAPSFRGWSRAGQLRDAADLFQAVTLHAQSQAATDSVTYSLTIASDGTSYQLARASDSTLDASDTSDAETFPLSKQLSIQLVNVIGGDGKSIRFSPTGSTTPARVRISADWGESVELACVSAIAAFTRVKQE